MKPNNINIFQQGLRALLITAFALLIAPLNLSAQLEPGCTFGHETFTSVDYTFVNPGPTTYYGSYNQLTNNHIVWVFNLQAGDRIEIDYNTGFNAFFWFYQANGNGIIEVGDNDPNGVTHLAGLGGYNELQGPHNGSGHFTAPTSGQYAVLLDNYTCELGTKAFSVTFGVTEFSFNSCAASNTFSPVVMNSPFFEAGANQPNTYYWGISTGYIKANPTGGIGPYTYQWSSKAGYAIKGDTKQRARIWYPTGPHWVKVAITDVGANCSFEDSIYIDWIDFTCNKPFIWWYELCNNTSNTTVCVATTRAMRDSVSTGNYTFGPCLAQKTTLNTEIAGIKLYPNPTNSVINVASMFEYNSAGTLEILDLNGKVLYAQSISISEEVFEYGLNVNYLTNGMYMIRIRTDREIIVERFQIVK